MADVRQEDLFAESTMSFGDHIEELRVCLFRAVLGLAVGFCVGLYFADSVVRFIKRPLEKSLAEYYRTGAVADYQRFAAEREAAGLPLPYSVDQVRELVDQQGMIFTQYKVHRDALRTSLGLESETPPKTDAKTAESAEGKSGGSSAIVGPFETIFFWRPLTDDERVFVQGLSPQEAFVIWIKAALLAGVVISSPWIFYQLWIFVAAGLYPHEKRFVHLFLPISIVLFIAGAALCFFVIFHYVLDFFFTYNRSLGISPDPRISEWLGFALLMPIGFGISFQMPLVMLFLNRIGVFTIDTYMSKWRIAVLLIFVISMILTPGGDPFSMLAMAFSLTGLYFGGIVLCRYLKPKQGLLDA